MSLRPFQRDHVRGVLSGRGAIPRKSLAEMHTYLAACCESGFAANIHADLAELYGGTRPDMGTPSLEEEDVL